MWRRNLAATLVIAVLLTAAGCGRRAEDPAPAPGSGTEQSAAPAAAPPQGTAPEPPRSDQGQSGYGDETPGGGAPASDPPKADPPASDPPKADPLASDPPKADPPASDPPKADPPEPAGGNQGQARRYAVVGAQSEASYTVQEKFLDRNLDAVAVGRTAGITGALVLQDGRLLPSTVTVDMTSLQSDNRNRDNQLRTRAIETSKYPTATFAVTGMDGPEITAGAQVSVRLHGNATIHGVTRPLTWEGTAQVSGDILRIEATVTFKMELFDIQPPNILNIIAVDDTVVLNVSLSARAE